MNGEGSLVQIALKLEAGLVDEVFVLRIAVLERLLAQVGQKPDGLKVDVENRVGIRQQANRVGRGALSQQDGGDDTAGYDQDNREGDPQLLSASSHG